MPDIPAYVSYCCTRLRDAGHAAFPVGGCVRDLLLGRQPGDWDVATSARPEKVISLFERTVPTGLRHGTVTVLLWGARVEITTFRREGDYSDGRRPDSVSFDAGLVDDLSRRDFTINAMALDEKGGILDPFGGREDLAHRLIRCVGSPRKRFAEDGLRMLRAVRFSAQMGFEIEKSTAAALSSCAPQSARLAAERVRVEVEKTLTAPCPERGNLLFSLGLISPWLSRPAAPDLGGLKRLPPEPLYRWAGLCALLGDLSLLRALRPDRRTANVCAGVLEILAAMPYTGSQWRRVLARYGERTALVAAAVGGMEEELSSVLAEKPCYTVGALALTGADLMAMGLEGRCIGQAQRRLLEHVLDHPRDNVRQTLERLLTGG